MQTREQDREALEMVNAYRGERLNVFELADEFGVSRAQARRVLQKYNVRVVRGRRPGRQYDR